MDNWQKSIVGTGWGERLIETSFSKLGPNVSSEKNVESLSKHLIKPLKSTNGLRVYVKEV